MGISAKDIADAWNSVTDEWVPRLACNKCGYEVVHNWGGDVIDDATMKVVAHSRSYDKAEKRAKKLEDEARGAAVLKMIAARITEWLDD